MRVLFLSQTSLSAAMEPELSGLTADLQVEIVRDATDTLRQVAIGGRFEAVLLGTEVVDALAFTRMVRSDNLPVAVIGLIGSLDLEAGVQLIAAGADDYVMHRPGSAVALPRILRRACGQHGPERRTPPRVLYAGHTAGDVPRPAPLPRSAGATRVLLRTEDMEHAGDNAAAARAESGDTDVLQTGPPKEPVP
jgi:hypothetical protein